MHDGDLDLLIGGASSLWRNNGNGTFTVVSEEKGFAREGAIKCTGNVIGSDLNNDRAVDLVSTCPSGPPLIYLNPREGKFPVMQIHRRPGGWEKCRKGARCNGSQA